MKKMMTIALFSMLILTLFAGVEAQGLLSSWEVSVDFVPPEQEHLEIFLNIKNTGTEDISGLQIGVAADSLEYIEGEKLSFGDDEDEKLEVTVEQDQGTSIVTVIFPRNIEAGQNRQLLLAFDSAGVLQKKGSEYEARVQLREPKLILENGNKVTPEFDTGSFRVHTPEGFIYTKHSPTPWRKLWQGVSGFNAHFVLIFNGGTPMTETISVSFRESELIKRAVELYKDVKDQERNKARSQEELDEANRHITNGANQMITGNQGLAKTELDEAESILTGKPLEEVISEDVKVTENGDKPTSTAINPIYFIGLAVVVLILVLLVFGKNLISVLKGGKKDEK